MKLKTEAHFGSLSSLGHVSDQRFGASVIPQARNLSDYLKQLVIETVFQLWDNPEAGELRH